MLTNETLKRSLQIQLNKNPEVITSDDLGKVITISISTVNSEGEHTHDFKDLLQLKKLERLIIVDSLLSKEEIEVLCKIQTLNSIEFTHCMFGSDDFLSELTMIQFVVLDNCLIRDYSFLEKLTNLIELQILNPYGETDLSLKLLNNKTKLRKLRLERCMLCDFGALAFAELEELSLLYTKIDDLSFLDNCPKLSIMFLPVGYLENETVKKNNVRIDFKTDLMEYVFEDDKKNK